MLYQYDSAIYLWINHWPHPEILNWIAIVLHYATRGMLIYLMLIFILLLVKKYRETLFILVSGLVTAGVVDVILKPLIHRMRPFVYLSDVSVLYPLPTSYSFPSAQTAVAFAVAVACIVIFHGKHWRWLWFWAILVGIDRIYMGHHYPSDVISGTIIGISIPLILKKMLYKKETRN